MKYRMKNHLVGFVITAIVLHVAMFFFIYILDFIQIADENENNNNPASTT